VAALAGAMGQLSFQENLDVEQAQEQPAELPEWACA
jgi:hypothetical protein